MATAYKLPHGAQVTIGIQPGGTVTPGDENWPASNGQSITFQNGAGFPVNILFTSPIADILGLPNGAPSSSFTASNIIVNYTIYNANLPPTAQPVGGPYSVDFGLGVLPISINASDTNPDPVAIPNGGKIQFTCDTKYKIAWSIAKQPAPGAWMPQITQLQAGVNPVLTAQPGANSQTVAYTITAGGETHGGGTVVLGP